MCYHFHPLLERAGLPAIRFHDLRHPAATLMLLQGINPKIVSELLGQATECHGGDGRGAFRLNQSSLSGVWQNMQETRRRVVIQREGAHMATNIPADREYWRANALNVYAAYLSLQPLGTAIYEQMRDDAETARLKPDDERLMRLLRETGDSECVACADRYPDREV